MNDLREIFKSENVTILKGGLVVHKGPWSVIKMDAALADLAAEVVRLKNRYEPLPNRPEILDEWIDGGFRHQVDEDGNWRAFFAGTDDEVSMKDIRYNLTGALPRRIAALKKGTETRL